MGGPASPLGSALRGLAAGVAGTALMTGWQELAARLRSPGDERDPPADPWESAPAPAKVAKLTLEGLFGQRVGPERIGLLTNVMHWGYGAGWGTLFGLWAGGRPRGSALRRGLALGTAVWASSYAQLVPLGIYEPPWRYAPGELALDLSHHLVYGTGVAAAHAALPAA